MAISTATPEHATSGDTDPQSTETVPKTENEHSTSGTGITALYIEDWCKDESPSGMHVCKRPKHHSGPHACCLIVEQKTEDGRLVIKSRPCSEMWPASARPSAHSAGIREARTSLVRERDDAKRELQSAIHAATMHADAANIAHRALEIATQERDDACAHLANQCSLSSALGSQLTNERTILDTNLVKWTNELAAFSTITQIGEICEDMREALKGVRGMRGPVPEKPATPAPTIEERANLAEARTRASAYEADRAAGIKHDEPIAFDYAAMKDAIDERIAKQTELHGTVTLSEIENVGVHDVVTGDAFVPRDTSGRILQNLGPEPTSPSNPLATTPTEPTHEHIGDYWYCKACGQPARDGRNRLVSEQPRFSCRECFKHDWAQSDPPTNGKTS